MYVPGGVGYLERLALNKINELPDETIKSSSNFLTSGSGLIFSSIKKRAGGFRGQPKRADTSGTEIQERYRIGKCSLMGGEFPATPRVLVETINSMFCLISIFGGSMLTHSAQCSYQVTSFSRRILIDLMSWSAITLNSSRKVVLVTSTKSIRLRCSTIPL